MIRRMILGVMMGLTALGAVAQDMGNSEQPDATAEVQPARVQFGIDFGYSLGLSQREFGQNFTRKDGNMYSLSIKALGLYNIDRHWTAGVGIGIDNYNYGPNTMPIFLTGRFRPFEGRVLNGFYAFTDLGYAPHVGNYSAGMLWNLGLGWRKMFRSHFGINAQFGYGLNQFRTPYYEYDIASDNIHFTELHTNIWRHSLRFSIGLLF